MIGREMDLSYNDMNNLKLSAVLHDIGKIGIEDKILKKKAPLTEEEFEVMREHPRLGYEILGHIDFTVFPKQDSLFGRTPLLWAEAKTGNFDIPTMFVQLILTIGKARTFDKTLPPAFLGAFDFKKIAFVDYVNIQDIFYLNDFNWNVTPSNHETKAGVVWGRRA